MHTCRAALQGLLCPYRLHVSFAQPTSSTYQGPEQPYGPFEGVPKLFSRQRPSMPRCQSLSRCLLLSPWPHTVTVDLMYRHGTGNIRGRTAVPAVDPDMSRRRRTRGWARLRYRVGKGKSRAKRRPSQQLDRVDACHFWVVLMLLGSACLVLTAFLSSVAAQLYRRLASVSHNAVGLLCDFLPKRLLFNPPLWMREGGG